MLFQELGKIKRSSIMTSIILMVLGVTMILCPARYVDALVSTLGYVILIFAAYLIMEFLSSKRVLINYIYLTGALILALLGIAVLVFYNHMVLVIGIVFGLVLLIDGITGIVNTLMYARRSGRRGWWVLIVLDTLMIVFGLIVLVNPFWNEPTMLFDVIGGMLLFSSVVSIVRLFILWPIKVEKEG